MQRILNRREQPQIPLGKEIRAPKRSLHRVNPRVGQRSIPPILIQNVLPAKPEAARHLVHAIRKRGIARLAARQHQRNARLVYQNRVGLINHGGRKRPMHLFRRIERNLIAQKIEADLVRCGVGNVAVVCPLAFFGVHALLNAAHREAEDFIDRAHPLRIAPSQVVVHRHHMNTLTRLRMPGNRRHCRQSLSFPGLHLGDSSTGERKRALKLHVEQLQPQQSFRGYRRNSNRL